MEQIGPKSGDGPKPERLDLWSYTIEFKAKDEAGNTASATVTGKGQPGYKSTADIIGQVGILLAKNDKRLPDLAGILTPASALGLDILDEFAKLIPSCGLAGEIKAAKLLYLALVTRILFKPTSVVVDGPSAAGKSYLVEKVLKFFPIESYHDLTAMSERDIVLHLIVSGRAGLWYRENRRLIVALYHLPEHVIGFFHCWSLEA